jgi:HD domain
VVTSTGQRLRTGSPDCFPPVVWLYIAAVVGAASFVFVRGFVIGHSWQWLSGRLDILLVLSLLFMVCESSPTTLTSRQSSFAPSSSAALAAVVLLGPVGAALVGTTTLLSVRRWVNLPQRIFNASMLAVSAYAAGEVYLALGGHVGPPHLGDYPGIIAPFAAATLVHVSINHALLWGMLLLVPHPDAKQHAGRVRLHIPLLFVSDTGYATLGLLIAALWGGRLGAFAAVLVLVPLFVGRWAMGQFAAQERAYEATMAALCQAVETKDLYTRGHSERVSRGSAMIAREVGMRANRVEAIRYAGMLHDVGKLGVPTTVLQKRGPLTEEEYAAIQLHPMRGLEIVREIGFLDEALAGIMHHHERMDGRGYPMGLAGDEIPEFARVIAVADAFDSMTSNRSYRGARSVEEAVADLRKWSGTQFDPALVDAFVAALTREGWSPPEPAAVPSRDGQGFQDHDDPTTPLRVVESR